MSLLSREIDETIRTLVQIVKTSKENAKKSTLNSELWTLNSELWTHFKAGYQKVKNMLEIEYQTSKLADQLPGDSSSLAFQKIEELEQLEEQKEQISLMLNPQ